MASESQLTMLATDEMEDRAWLATIGALGHSAESTPAEVLAVLVFAR